MNDKVYDVLKWIAQIVIPALATLVVAVAGIWGWPPYGEEIGATLIAIDTFLGVILGISTYEYNKDDDTDIEGD